jgi:hypothetical protein
MQQTPDFFKEKRDELNSRIGFYNLAYFLFLIAIWILGIFNPILLFCFIYLLFRISKWAKAADDEIDYNKAQNEILAALEKLLLRMQIRVWVAIFFVCIAAILDIVFFSQIVNFLDNLAIFLN